MKGVLVSTGADGRRTWGIVLDLQRDNTLATIVGRAIFEIMSVLGFADGRKAWTFLNLVYDESSKSYSLVIRESYPHAGDE